MSADLGEVRARQAARAILGRKDAFRAARIAPTSLTGQIAYCK
jgi:hypothetical protein